jgi:hypothetical protein
MGFRLGRVHGGSGLYPFTSPSYTGLKASQSPFGPARNGLRPLIRLWDLQPTPKRTLIGVQVWNLASTHVVSQSR